MQYAVIATGGKQYIATPGQQLVVETLPQTEGETVIFDQVLLYVDGNQVQVGRPLVPNVTVSAKVIQHSLGHKIKVFKYKPKSRYRRTQGHRQHQTVVAIESMGSQAAPGRPTEAKQPARAAKSPSGTKRAKETKQAESN